MKRVWPAWFRAYEHATLPGGRVLSIGCGTGGLLRRFGNPAQSRFGSDVDIDSLKSAAKVYPVCAADVTRMPYGPDTFSCITAEWMFEHLPDKAAAIAELARVLKPGGRILILTTNAHSPLAWLARLFPKSGSRFRRSSLGIDERGTWNTHHAHNSIGELSRCMSEQGLHRVEFYRISHIEYYFIHLGILRLLSKLYDAVFRLPPLSLLSNAFLIVFEKNASQ